ncbi:MAG: hypothetical protein V3T14_06535 [Myxococcota bacterium]
MRKRPGPKPLPRSERRTNRLTILLTDAERRKLERAAARKDLPAGTLAHTFVVRALGRHS